MGFNFSANLIEHVDIRKLLWEIGVNKFIRFLHLEVIISGINILKQVCLLSQTPHPITY